MRAILIDATRRQVVEIDLDVSGGSLAPLQAAVGGLIDTAFRFPNEDCVFVNDEGLLQEPLGDAWFFVEGGHQPFVGNGILVGIDRRGETVAAKTPLTDIRRLVRFLTLDEVYRITGF